MSGTKEFFYDWMGANEVIFQGVNSLHSAGYDKFMKYVSWVGEHENFPYYLAAVFACSIFSLLIQTLRRNPGKWRTYGIWIGVMVMLVVGYGATAVVTDQLKSYYSYPRPYVALAATGEVHKLEATTAKDDFRSFPSGHMVFSTFMLMALMPVLGGFLFRCGLILIVLMAWSRMALGMHFPADVIGGMLLTIPLISLLRWFLYTLMRKFFGVRC